jgi:hypothetical protein
VTVVGALAATVVPATPAFASGDGVPNLGDFVLWRDANWTGPLYDLDNHALNYDGLVYVGSGTAVDNNASSAANYYDRTGVQIFTLRNRGGGTIQLTRYDPNSTGWYINQPRLAATVTGEANRNGQFNFDDNISSHRFL